MAYICYILVLFLYIVVLSNCIKTLQGHSPRGSMPGIATWIKDTTGYVNVPYVIDSSLSEDGVKVLNLAITEYKRNTCINLKPRTSTDADFVSFQDDSTGCWSYMGRIGGLQEINIQDGGCTDAMGTMLHEIAHALGVHHEQSRPDRDQYVAVYPENIEEGKENNFEKVTSINSLGTEYDFLSMMHYPSTAFAIGDSYTILKSDGVTTLQSQRNGFSQIDVEQINLLYSCDGVNEAIEKPSSCYYANDNGLSYRGEINNVTISSTTFQCEPWSNVVSIDEYYSNDLQTNLCRNPNPMIYSRPICYLLIEGKIFYGTCDVPECHSDPVIITTTTTTTTPTTTTRLPKPIEKVGNHAINSRIVPFMIYFVIVGDLFWQIVVLLNFVLIC